MCRLDPPQRAPHPGCRDRGSGSYDPAGYEVGREPPCLLAGVRRDQHLALDLRALIRGFWTPAPSGRSCGLWAGVRNPPREETAGQKGTPVWSGVPMGILGLRTAGERGVGGRGRLVSLSGAAALAVLDGDDPRERGVGLGRRRTA